jgi:hypothetical protein
MNNKKCPYCGFINFMSAELCRKCETNLTAPEESYETAYDQPSAYRGGVNSSAQPIKSGFTAGKTLTCVAGLVFGAIVYTFGMGLIRGHANVNWIEYHPDGLSITVMMPNEPKREEPKATPLPTGSVSLHMFMSEVSGQGVAGFGYSDYVGVEIGDTSQALEDSLDGLVKKSNSKLVSKTPINYQGMPGLEFEVTPPESAGIKNAQGYGKILLDHNRLYILFIAASESTDLIAGKDKFLNPMLYDASRPAVIKIPPMAPIEPLPRVR